MQLELSDCAGFKTRPDDFVSLLSIFPNGLYDEAWTTPIPKPGKEKPTSCVITTGLLKGTNVTADELAHQIRLFRDFTAGKIESKGKRGKAIVTSVKRPSRQSELMSARVCAVTTTHWPASTSRLQRDLTFLCAVGITEHFLLETIRYRQALLPSALGELRRKFHSILDPCVKEYPQAVPGGGTRNISSWVFIDRLEAPGTAVAPPVNLKLLHATARRDRDRSENKVILRRLRGRLENHPSAWAASEEDEDNSKRALDSDVAEHADAMLLAIWTNMERSLYRNYMDDQDAEFNVNDQEPIPDDCLTTRHTESDAHTVGTESASALRVKTTRKKAQTDVITTIVAAPTPIPMASTTGAPAPELSIAVRTTTERRPQWVDDPSNLTWPERRARLEKAKADNLKASTISHLQEMLKQGGLVAPKRERPNYWKKDDFHELFDAALAMAVAGCPIRPVGSAAVDCPIAPVGPASDTPKSNQDNDPSRHASQEPVDNAEPSHKRGPSADRTYSIPLKKHALALTHQFTVDEEESRKKARLDDGEAPNLT